MISLLGSIALHIAYGFVLTMVVWLSGLAWLTSRDDVALANDGRLSLAYPIGVLSVTTAAFVSLLPSAPLSCAAVALLAATCLFGAVRVRRLIPSLIRPFRLPLFLALVTVVTLVGLTYHGPTATLFASPLGDVVWYATEAQRFLRHPLPPGVDLLVEGYPPNTYLCLTPPVVAALFSRLPGHDPILFVIVSVMTFFLSSMAIGWNALLRPGASQAGRAQLLVSTILLYATPLYFSWLIESPRVAWALPLCFSCHYLLFADRLSLRRLLLASCAIILCIFTTKIFAFFPIAIIISLVLIRFIRNRLSFLKTAAVILALAVPTLYLVVSSIHHMDFVNVFTFKGVIERFSNIASGGGGKKLFLDNAYLACELVLVAVFLRCRQIILAIATMSSLCAYLLWPEFANISVNVVTCLAAVYAASRKLSAARVSVMALVSLVLLAVTILHDTSLGVTLAFAFWGMLYYALLVFDGRSRSPRLETRLVAPLALAALLSIALFLYKAPRDKGYLTPQDHDIWLQARKSTPDDALIFTDLTGETISLDQAWYTYSGVAGRQLYLGGWYGGSRIRWERGSKLHDRLELNKNFLEGKIPLSDVPLSRAYNGYYSVVSNGRHMSSAWSLLYTNRKYSLYKLRSSDAVQ